MSLMGVLSLGVGMRRREFIAAIGGTAGSGLLRPHCKRPNRRAADCRDELARPQAQETASYRLKRVPEPPSLLKHEMLADVRVGSIASL